MKNILGWLGVAAFFILLALAVVYGLLQLIRWTLTIPAAIAIYGGCTERSEVFIVGLLGFAINYLTNYAFLVKR
jgi:hypothetical protein